MALSESALCGTGDVATLLLRPLTTDETPYVEDLINKASDLLRNAAPSIDTRIGSGNISATTVATVVAGAVKRYIRNPEGLASQAAGPFSVAYALRSEKGPRGVLEITADDLAVIFPTRKRPRAGTIRTRPALAPRPVGRYGPLPGPEQVLEAVVDWSAAPPVDGGEIVEWNYDPDGGTK